LIVLIIITLTCAGAGLWWRLTFIQKQNVELQAEVLRLRGRLRALRA
jgi:hypothetical protein